MFLVYQKSERDDMIESKKKKKKIKTDIYIVDST